LKRIEKNIIVLGEDQKLYFEQIKAALGLLGCNAPLPVHYSFVLLSDGKMSTRKGTVVLLEEFMKEAVDKAAEEIKKRHPRVIKKTAKAIGYGAIKFAMLRVSNEKNVLFDWKHALNFEGETGPYIQYSYARIQSIIRKYKKKLPESADLSLLSANIEYAIVKELSYFPHIIDTAAKELSPHVLANYAFSLTKKFSEFYHTCPVLDADENLKQARLILIQCTAQVVKTAMSLIGIDVIDRM
jgi:arginyl-tRNA synthetase